MAEGRFHNQKYDENEEQEDNKVISIK